MNQIYKTLNSFPSSQFIADNMATETIVLLVFSFSHLKNIVLIPKSMSCIMVPVSPAFRLLFNPNFYRSPTLQIQ